MQIALAMRDVIHELDRATKQHGNFHSAHEGYAVIHEEMDELWAEVKNRHGDMDAMKREAIQVAAMALRFLVDIA